MCIALLSTAHPTYKLILLDNRDEFLSRPTAPAQWWAAPHEHVYGGFDLQRSAHGTWLGVTKQGKIAVLTNFREEDSVTPATAVSRGEIIKLWLVMMDCRSSVSDGSTTTTEEFVNHVVGTGVARDAGGFSLVCGRIGERLAVVSNRAGVVSGSGDRDREDKDGGGGGRSGSVSVPWICGDVVQTVGLSNTHFTDRTWKKVQDGEEGMLSAIRANVAEDQGDEQKLIERFLDLLSRDTLPRIDNGSGDGDVEEAYISDLRNTILVPVLGRKIMDSNLPPDEIAAAVKKEKAMVLRNSIGQDQQGHGLDALYGTQKQTIVLVDHEMRVRVFERTLYNEKGESIPRGQGDIDTTFTIDA